MKIFATTLIIIALSTHQILIGMDNQITRDVTQPARRQSLTTNTSISIADSQSPTEANTLKKMRLSVHHLRTTPCPDTHEVCKYLVIAGVIALIVFAFVPLPHNT